MLVIMQAASYFTALQAACLHLTTVRGMLQPGCIVVVDQGLQTRLGRDC